MIWIKRILIWLAMLVLILVPSRARAYYYEDFSEAPVLNVFELSPSSKELVMGPDETQTVSLRFRNMTARAYRFKITTTSFAGTQDGASSWRPRPEPSWLHPELKRFRLKSNEAIQFTTRVISPRRPPPGGHYELLFVSNLPETKRGRNVKLKGVSRLGAVFYITVPTGRLFNHIKLEQFATDQRFYSSGPVRFKVVLSNKGNIHSRLNGRITVVNRLTGFQAGSIKLTRLIVLPEAQKQASFSLPLGRPMGPFEARLRLRDARTGEVVTGTTEFYGFPWQAVVWTALVGLALLGVWSRLRQYRLVKISDLPSTHDKV